MQHDKVLILDFGSQYTQLIARRVRELNIYSEIHPFNKIPLNIDDYKAVILSGSPFSVRGNKALHPDLSKIRGKKPLLGVCYGAQYLAHFFGGNVAPSNTREYGRAHLSKINEHGLFFKGISNGSQVWMSHSDTIQMLPENGVLLASTDTVENAAFKIKDETTYAIQFHPEVYHSKDGKKLLENSLIANIPFESIGPTIFSGRVVDVDVSPIDPTHFYVAYASGGLWKTINNGRRALERRKLFKIKFIT